MVSRREFVIGASALTGAAAALIGQRVAAAPQAEEVAPAAGQAEAPAAGGGLPRGVAPVRVPNGVVAPFRVVDGVKVFHLTAGPIDHEICPGLTIKAFGYNGRTPGPVIEAVEGDRVRIYVTNRLPEGTSVHWHGVLLPNGMDGVSGLLQAPTLPGETCRYEFTFGQAGTFMYHPHFDEMTQMAMGLTGMIVVHPRRPRGPRVDRDYVYMLAEWAIPIGVSRPDPAEMSDFTIITLNSRAYPGTAPLLAQRGERVRIRFGNLSAMNHHPVHLHGHTFEVTETDGGAVRPGARWPETTVLVPTGSARVVEFIASAPGDWPLHCHMLHHIMNQMGHGIPNLLGADGARIDRKVRRLVPGSMTMGTTGMGGHAEHMAGMPRPRNSIPMLGARGPHGYIDMGGMFTNLKVRERLVGDTDPGDYEAPAGTRARAATAEELRADGIEVKR